jgi:hypothetical protein
LIEEPVGNDVLENLGLFMHLRPIEPHDFDEKGFDEPVPPHYLDRLGHPPGLQGKAATWLVGDKAALLEVAHHDRDRTRRHRELPRDLADRGAATPVLLEMEDRFQVILNGARRHGPKLILLIDSCKNLS